MNRNCLPFDMPSKQTFFEARRKVFAHYFYTFPLSPDNKFACNDYYNTQYLNPDGENGKWKPQGGFTRQRPLAVPVNHPRDDGANMEKEIDMAMDRGITGFTFDMLSLADAMSPTGKLQTLLLAAEARDPRFKIIPMFDMNAMTGLTADDAAELMNLIADYPALYRLDDGRIMMTAYNADIQGAEWWKSVIAQLNGDDVNVAFIPCLGGGNKPTDEFAAISYGYANWGTVIPSSSANISAEYAHSIGLTYMLPIGTQQYRPKNPNYWEASCSLSFRNSWLSAINTDADYVQIVTWSDFSESAQIQPYTDITLATDIGTGFYDLNAFFAAWYVTREMPLVERDALYWFHRRQFLGAPHPNQPTETACNGGTPEDSIEVVALLTADGQIRINDTVSDACGPVHVMKVPLQKGVPSFALLRNGSNVFAFDSAINVAGEDSANPNGLTDLTYWSGGGQART